MSHALQADSLPSKSPGKPQSTIFHQKSISAMEESCVQPLGQVDPLEKEMATHFSILVWKIPWTEESGRVTVHGVAKSQAQLSD